MKKRTWIVILAIACIVSAVVIAYKLQSPTKIERMEDDRVGVETTIEKTVDLKKFTFSCSAVFQVKQNEDDDTYYIDNVTSEFLERKRVPNEYTFVRKGEIETICEKEGESYIIKRTLPVEKMGRPVMDITAGARFVLDTKTGKMSAEALADEG